MLLKAWKQISDTPSFVYKHTVYQMPGSQHLCYCLVHATPMGVAKKFVSSTSIF
jgi:hypothetical protein